MEDLAAVHMRVESLRRYPVKSMLGEAVDSLFVDEGGAEGDRKLALVDTETGHVRVLNFISAHDVGHAAR